ncbi:hypothetical protein ABEB36_005237 [Hypothenemus hampei]|uniref:Ionotropic glutamate receptor C-terminal domain-containing protein n=1 Tax=Hypothenemus hampei TaxID=57062 RepID=A0ABD1EYI9_HYPHA
MLLNVVLVLACMEFAKGDVFPSLLKTNATMAVVVDREYLAEFYGNITMEIERYLDYAKREFLRHNGLNTQFFAWPAINLKRDLSILLSITSCLETWKLFAGAETENLLHIAISEQDCARLPPNSAITIPIIERGQETPQLLLDLRTMDIYKWKEIVIMYQDNIPDDLLTRIIKSITRKLAKTTSSGVSLIKLTTKTFEDINYVYSSIRASMLDINPKTIGGNFLVIVNLDLVEKIMEFAKELNLVNTQNQWLYLISNTNNRVFNLKRFKKLLREGDNVSFIYNSTVVNTTCDEGTMVCHIRESLTGVLKALDDAIVEESEMADQVSVEEYEAIRPTKSERKRYLLEKVQKYLTEYGSCNNCTKWKLEAGETWGREYQTPGENSIADIQLVGTWRPSDGPSMTDVLFPHIAHGFRSITLPLVSFHNPPWQILVTNSSGEVIGFQGIVFNIIEELSKNLNFTYSVEVIKNYQAESNNSAFQTYNNESVDFINMAENSYIKTYGVPQIVLDMVHNKSVALGACAFTITEENKRMINFTDPISIQTYTFLSARPRELSRALLFISPFAGDTWFCLATTIISMGPILFYIHKMSPVYEYKGIRVKGGLATIQNCIWYMYGALLQQGGMHLPYADSARIIVGAWWLVVLVIGTTYCGNLVAYLTFPKIEVPITTLQELIDHKDSVSWSYARQSLFEALIKDSTENVYKTIYEKARDISNKRIMIESIKAGKHVYIDWKIKLQYLMKQQFVESDVCNFALGIDEFCEERIGLIVSTDTPYLIKINEEIRKLHQVGLIQKWLEDYLPKRDKCWKKKRSVEVNNHTVNLDDMQGSFFVLLIGFSIAVFVIIVEKMWFKKINKKKNRRVIQPFVT